MTSTALTSALNGISADRIRKHIQQLSGIRHHRVDPDALERAADIIFSALQAMDYEVEPHVFQAYERNFRNIIATRLGSRFPEKRVLAIAHYDTMPNTPGADDNASGLAVLIELARRFDALQFDRTIQLIAVNLEESETAGDPGSWGSRALAAKAKEEGWEIEGVIVLESVAYAGETIEQTTPEGLPMQFPKTGDFLVVVGNEASGALAESFDQAVRRHEISLPIESLIVPGNGEAFPDTRRSDHSPFWDQGFPAVMLTDTCNFRNPNYHQPTDTPDTLNLAFAANVCRVLGGVVGNLAGVCSSGAG